MTEINLLLSFLAIDDCILRRMCSRIVFITNSIVLLQTKCNNFIYLFFFDTIILKLFFICRVKFFKKIMEMRFGNEIMEMRLWK